MSLGRVQTPVLKMIVDRWKAAHNFKPVRRLPRGIAPESRAHRAMRRGCRSRTGRSTSAVGLRGVTSTCDSSTSRPRQRASASPRNKRPRTCDTRWDPCAPCSSSPTNAELRSRPSYLTSPPFKGKSSIPSLYFCAPALGLSRSHVTARTERPIDDTAIRPSGHWARSRDCTNITSSSPIREQTRAT